MAPGGRSRQLPRFGGYFPGFGAFGGFGVSVTVVVSVTVFTVLVVVVVVGGGVVVTTVVVVVGWTRLVLVTDLVTVTSFGPPATITAVATPRPRASAPRTTAAHLRRRYRRSGSC